MVHLAHNCSTEFRYFLPLSLVLPNSSCSNTQCLLQGNEVGYNLKLLSQGLSLVLLSNTQSQINPVCTCVHLRRLVVSNMDTIPSSLSGSRVELLIFYGKVDRSKPFNMFAQKSSPCVIWHDKLHPIYIKCWIVALLCLFCKKCRLHKYKLIFDKSHFQ